jgi:single-strand DNA-binding protein
VNDRANVFAIRGRLTKEVELKTGKTGVFYANFTLAVNKRYNDSSNANEVKDSTSYISCIAYAKNAENLAKFSKKGQQIEVDGDLVSYNKETSTGNTAMMQISVSRIVFGNHAGYSGRPSGDSSDAILSSSYVSPKNSPTRATANIKRITGDSLDYSDFSFESSSESSSESSGMTLRFLPKVNSNAE